MKLDVAMWLICWSGCLVVITVYRPMWLVLAPWRWYSASEGWFVQSITLAYMPAACCYDYWCHVLWLCISCRCCCLSATGAPLMPSFHCSVIQQQNTIIDIIIQGYTKSHITKKVAQYFVKCWLGSSVISLMKTKTKTKTVEIETKI